MGKVLNQFPHGFKGDVTRAHDNVIISVKNVDAAPIEFGRPVFLKAQNNGVINFLANTTTEATFVGFACRVADKTPPSAGVSPNDTTQNEGRYEPGEPVDILVRGSMCVACASSSARAGDALYIRKSDGMLVNSPGSEGTTVPVPNTTIRGVRDPKSQAEIVITKRNLI